MTNFRFQNAWYSNENDWSYLHYNFKVVVSRFLKKNTHVFPIIGVAEAKFLFIRVTEENEINNRLSITMPVLGFSQSALASHFSDWNSRLESRKEDISWIAYIYMGR
jgi:hypothetical protein